MFFRGRGLLRTAPICQALAGMASGQTEGSSLASAPVALHMSEAGSGKIDGHTAGRSQSTTDRCAIGVGPLLDVIETTPQAIRRDPFKFSPITKLHPGAHLLVANNIDPTESKYPCKNETTIHISE